MDDRTVFSIQKFIQVFLLRNVVIQKVPNLGSKVPKRYNWHKVFNSQAFSHFTFERSGHQLIVVDIQGEIHVCSQDLNNWSDRW